MTDRDEVISILRATLLSCKEPLTLRECNRDYRELQGENIPYQKLGFPSLQKLFETLPGFLISQSKDGETFIDVVASSASSNIVQLVAKQKSTKKQTNRALPPRMLRYPSNNPYKKYNKDPSYYHSGISKQYNPEKKIIRNYPVKPQVDSTAIKKMVKNNVSKSPESIPQIPTANDTTNYVKQRESSERMSGKPMKIEINTGAANVTSNIKVPSKAASRLSALQSKIQEEAKIVDAIGEELQKLTFDDTLKCNKTRLLRLCELKKMTPPVFKTSEIQKKGRNKALYDCSLKIFDKVFFTYPNSLSTLELAVETVSGEALQYFQKSEQHKEIVKPLTSTTVALERVLSMVNSCPSGFIAEKLPDVYLEKYQEKLPENWRNMIENSPMIKIEQGVNGFSIFLPNYQKNVNDMASSPASTSSYEELNPPPLQYPEDIHWNIYVMSAASTDEVCFRIIGEQYSSSFEAMNTDMEIYYLSGHKPSDNITEGSWYALKTEDAWLRAKIIELNFQNQSALCDLPDMGDKEYYPLSSLYDIPSQFLTLPLQAVFCRLSGLEEITRDEVGDLAFTDLFVGKVLIAEIVEENPYSVILYDTSTDEDLNINQMLLQQLAQGVKSPRLSPGISEIHICDVQANGAVYAQIHNREWLLLQKMIKQLVNGPFLKEALQTGMTKNDIVTNMRYLVKSSDGKWLRGLLKFSLNNDNFVMATYIDYGHTERVSLKDIIRLDGLASAVSTFPPQVLKLHMHNVPPLSNEHLEFLNKLIPSEASVLCKETSPGSNAIEIFVRVPPHNFLCNVNHTIIMEIELANSNPKNASTNQCSSPLPNYSMPEIKSQFEVCVMMVANPSNFMVQSLSHRNKFNSAMQQMKNFSIPSKPVKPIIGSPYAACNSDGVWHRVIVQSIMSNNLASVYFCDDGYLQMMEVNKLRELPSELKGIPAQAIRAKLYGVSPVNTDWSVEDCIRFKEIVVNKNFKSIVENIEDDPLQKNEPLLTLNLMDMSNNGVCVSDILLKERRAKKSVY